MAGSVRSVQGVRTGVLLVVGLAASGCHVVGGLDEYERAEIVCVDVDGDGRGEGCPLGADCDDSLSVCHDDCADADGDGIADCNACMHDPRLIGTLDTEGSVHDIALQGNYAYLADGEGGLVVADISNPTAPMWVGNLPPPPTYYGSGIRGVDVDGDYAYLSGQQEGLSIADVSNPAAPALLGCGACDDAYGDAWWSVQIVWPKAYLADVSSMRIFDVTDPNNPVQYGNQMYGTYRGSWVEDVRSVTVSGSLAYLGCKSGLQIVDVKDPEVAFQVGDFASSFVNEVFVRDPHAYVANDANLYVLDVTNPAAPAQIGLIDTFGGATGVFVAGGYAYVGDNADGNLVIVDVSSPANAQEVGSVYTGGARTALMRDGYVYVAGGERGLRIVSVVCEQPTASSAG